MKPKACKCEPWLIRGVVAALLLALIAGSVRAQAHSFDSAGVKIHYRVVGEGEPVLLIHGFAGNIYVQWFLPGIVQALAKDHQVIAYDCRGHGFSGKPRDPKKYGQEMVEDAIRLLDHLGIERAHVVGYSMGGFITSKLVATHPDRVLTATMGGAGWLKAGDERAEFMTELADSLDRGEGIGPLLIRLTPPGREPPGERDLKALNQLLKMTNDSKALSGVIRGMPDLAVTEEELKANKVPTLALIGDLDPMKVTVDDMEKVMANLEVVVLQGGDHMRAFALPEFTTSLRAFLKRHSSEMAELETQ
jgi:pimeloyl-ACP methyl ester carboxylesterase